MYLFEYVSFSNVFSLNMYPSEYVYFLNMNMLLFQKRFLFEYISFSNTYLFDYAFYLTALHCIIASVHAIELGNDYLFDTNLLLTQ